MGRAEREQTRLIAEWRGRPFRWERVDEHRRQFGRAGRRFERLPAEVVSPDPGPLESAVSREQVEWLRDRIGRMPDRLRSVVLCRLAGETHAQVGERLGVSEHRAWQLWTEAVDRIIAPMSLDGVGQVSTVLDGVGQVSTVLDGEIGSVRPMSEVEREAIGQALRATGGDVAHAARLLEIGKQTIYRRLESWGLSPLSFSKSH